MHRPEIRLTFSSRIEQARIIEHTDFNYIMGLMHANAYGLAENVTNQCNNY